MDKARELALKALYEIDKNDAYSTIALNEILNKNKDKINLKDIGLISEIVYGVTTYKLSLDEIIKKYSKIKLKKISMWIINILRMGIYQIIFLDKIPKSAAVNESVNLAKKYGHQASSSFVNAILRNVNKNDYEEFFNIKDDVERISKVNSMPEWIIKKLLENNNIEKVEKICENLRLKPNITIRVNTLKINKQNLEKKLEENNVEFKETKYENFLILDKLKNIENFELFKEGLFIVQDISAGMTALILDPKPGDYCLDACAAPGGKTTHLAEIMKNKGKILALDLYESRVKLIEENAKRLGINIIKTKTLDSTIYYKNLENKFDKILLDVPCSGIGVIKRKPDIKWHRKEEDILDITKTQKIILENASKYLKQNGEMVYSTCSILKEENEDIINEFLEKNNNFKIEKISENSTFINILPDDEKDGFFICKLIKK